jgi:hypothetical protein
VQEAVDEDRARLLVDLILHRLAALRDLDECVDVVRRVLADGDLGEVQWGAFRADTQERPGRSFGGIPHAVSSPVLATIGA